VLFEHAAPATMSSRLISRTATFTFASSAWLGVLDYADRKGYRSQT
jgi:hypothetical protein